MAMRHREAGRWTAVTIALGIAAILASAAVAGDVVGWRTDGTGKYLDANPTIEWSPEKSIIWKTEMPSKSNATPVIVGDRLFVCSEPSSLVCVSLADGQILWERTNNFEDMVDAEEAAKMTAAHQEAVRLRKQRSTVSRNIWKLKRQLQENKDDAELKAKLDDIQKQVAEISKQLDPYEKSWYSLPDVHATNGFTSATPVSDGEHVFVSFGTGLVACYDLDGNKVWARMVEKPRIGWGSCSSPVIVDGQLMVLIHHLFALDKATGETIWSTPAEWSWATPLAVRLGDTSVVVTGNGDVFRVSDGKQMAKRLAKLPYGSPIVDGDTAYFVNNKGKAFRLSLSEDGETVDAEKLWDTSPKKARYYGAAVIHDGLLYAVNQAGVFSVIDAETGEIVYDKRLKFGKGATCYPSVTMAGGYLLVSSDTGETYVVKPGREFEQVAKNDLEPFRSSPVFVGDLMYLRGLKNLYCIGPVDEGAAE